MPSEETIRRIVEYAGKLDGLDPKVLREGLEIATLHHRAERAIEDDLSNWGLTVRQIGILEVLFHHSDKTLTPADLSEEVGLTRSAMTSALDSLEELGYTVRAAHPTDRRMIAIALTPRGREFISMHLPEHYERLCRVMGNLSAEARKVLKESFLNLLDFIAAEQRKADERRRG